MDDNILTPPSIDQEHLDRFYNLSHDSVKVITDIINGKVDIHTSESDKFNCVKRNVEHLEFLLTISSWENKDISSWYTAIDVGNKYYSEANG